MGGARSSAPAQRSLQLHSRAFMLALALAAPAPLALAAIDTGAMDRSVDPCVDFYGFANKRWLDTVKIPADRARWGSFDILGESANHTLERALSQGLGKPLPPEGSARRKVLEYYASGMDEAAIARASTQALVPFLGAIRIVDGVEPLARAMAELHARRIFAGFMFDVRPDPKDSTRYLAGIGQDGLGLPDRDYYFLEDARTRAIRDAYRIHLARVLEANGDTPPQAEERARGIIALETELARASMTAVERRDVDKTYNRMGLADLEKLAPEFPWKSYFDALGLASIAQLNVRQPEFIRRFAQLVATRPAGDWRAYLRWQLLKASSDKLDPRYESLHFDFYERTLLGKQEPATRAKRVIRVIGGNFGTEPLAEGLGQLYVDEAFPPEAKARMLQMTSNIKEALRDRLKSVEWMTEETRASSLAKLDAMKVKIGYPDRWRDFAAAGVGPRTFVDNWLSANRFHHLRSLARIGQPVDRDEWFTSPHIVNAFYSASNNEIVFPAAILQPPFFDPKADDAVNYGGIGMVIGHEITHGFDDRGRRFDKDGNLRDWWTEEDSRRYKERAKRIESQYGTYTGVDGIKVNGALTLGENISDIGGLKIAYGALRKALADKPHAPIDGFTPDQRFFLSFAAIWRAQMRPEQERVRLRTDSHSLPALRVRGVVTNIPEFARAFSCDASKALLAPALRADIW
jgi:putative endopeptidase